MQQAQKPKRDSKKAPKASRELPVIPDRLYFTIGEVSRLCDLKPHVLRYWEQEFSQLSPTKRRGNRRYYQRKDVLLVRQIKTLLYEQGFTIEGAKAQLSGNTAPTPTGIAGYPFLKEMIADLENVLFELET